MLKNKKFILKVCGLIIMITCNNNCFTPNVLAEDASNLVTNGDFEKTSDQSWKVEQLKGNANISFDDKVFHGNFGHSEKVQGSSVQSGVYEKISVQPGKKYTLTGWLKAENITCTSEEHGACIGIVEVDKNGNYLMNTIDGVSKVGTFDWKQVQVSFVADSNASNVIVAIGLEGSGTVWSDDISLTETTTTVKRLSAENRIGTSLEIANEEFNGKSPDAVILTTANDFPDALSGANLAFKYKAPILLVNKTVDDSKSTLEYINSNLSKDKSIYILGGTGVVSSEIENYLKSQGYNSIFRLAGSNRYSTNQSIFKQLNVSPGTSIVIATGESFADALSISSIAAYSGYPILLNTRDNLLDNVKEDIAELQPSNVYIIGGSGVISDNVADEISKISSNIKLKRIGGANRYDTSLKIIDAFNLTSDTITIATGENFPDALSGSLLAANKNSGILLVNNTVMPEQKELIKKHNIKNIYVLGGEGALTKDTVNTLTQ